MGFLLFGTSTARSRKRQKAKNPSNPIGAHPAGAHGFTRGEPSSRNCTFIRLETLLGALFLTNTYNENAIVWRCLTVQ